MKKKSKGIAGFDFFRDMPAYHISGKPPNPSLVKQAKRWVNRLCHTKAIKNAVQRVGVPDKFKFLVGYLDNDCQHEYGEGGNLRWCDLNNAVQVARKHVAETEYLVKKGGGNG